MKHTVLLNESNFVLADIDKHFKVIGSRVKKTLISLAVTKCACLRKLQLKRNQDQSKRMAVKSLIYYLKLLHVILLFGSGQNKLKGKLKIF